jgi:1,4-alpha-glucan branching enzyme
VLLAGNFTNWEAGAIPMLPTDRGWSLPIKLPAGKYLYKFIVDGNWITDPDNKTTENDNSGNTNSVYYCTNTVFKLDGFTNAKRVVVAGSFDNWHDKLLVMNKTATGWELPIYLANGTYTYRFVVDGKWMEDPANANHVPNEFNAFNSVISIGTSTLFNLPGHIDAQKVFLVGSFNAWHRYELLMNKTTTGWQLPYTLGAGNYEYKFLADGKWLNAAGETIEENTPGNIMVIAPNYTFRLKDTSNTKKVFLAGDFNNWSPNAYLMKKENGEWTFTVHLSPGKHLYKFVADGKWMRDPANKLWENPDGNSVLWVK